MDSQQDSSAPAVPVMLFKNVPTRARNNYQSPQPMRPINVPNQPVALVVHINATDLARTMATVISE